MLASLSDMLTWKPAAFHGEKGHQRRAATTTSELGDSSDEILSETESIKSNQCRAPSYLRRQESYFSSSGPHKLHRDTQRKSEKNGSHPVLHAVYSFARAGITTSSKLFVVKSRQTPKTPTEDIGTTPKKSHCHSVEFMSSWELSNKIMGARVATSFGLGKISAIREEDGVAAIELQASGLLYLHATERDHVHVIPALIDECVYTPSGVGRVVKYDGREQLYTLRLGAGTGLNEYKLQLRSSDVQLVGDSSKPRCTSEPRYSRGLSEGSNATWESRRSSVRLSGAGSANGLAMLRNIAATSYTFVASKYHQGQPVITKFGAGHILSVDPQRKSAQIHLIWGAVAYLNADMIDYYPKALEGTDVRTKFGSGIVIGLRPADGIYTVRLHDLQPVGKSNVVFVHESDMHRNRRIAVKAANVRDKLKAMAQRRFGERIVVAHQSHDEEPNSAGI